MDPDNDTIKDEENYKKKYYTLIREIGRVLNTMDSRCPMVKSCCGGCVAIKTKLNREKKDIGWISIKD